MAKDPRRLKILFPSIPDSQLLARYQKWYEDRLKAQMVDLLRATGHYAVSRDLLSTQKRKQIPAERQVKIGRKVYYILSFSELPKRARIYRDTVNDWPVIEPREDEDKCTLGLH
jgi:hypothetical protein